MLQTHNILSLMIYFISIGCFMKNLTQVLAILLSFAILPSSYAQEAEQEMQSGFIIDELTIYMHAGPGTNYRILGTITAGTQIQITGQADKGYNQIIDDKGRTTWIESKYITDKPGLRFVVAELNGKIASSSEFTSQLEW